MGLFLYLAGPVSPTETIIVDEVQRCEGANNQSYVCESGHCCGESQCCSYYYELWWFWLVWAIIFILSCCCVCHHRRTKHRLQQQQRQHEINLIAYREAHNYTSPPFYFRFLPNYLLPEYEEVMNRPATPPPPYSALNAGPPPCTAADQQEAHCPSRQATPVPPVSETLCSRANIEEFHTSGVGVYHHKDNSKVQTLEEMSSVEKQDMGRKGQLREGEEKERNAGRRRRFTGDSGIEVCVCGRGHSSKELEGLLSEEGQDDFVEFCEGCGHHSYGDEEQGAEHGASPHPVCLNLQTINELDGPHHGDTESQS
ncbi:WW domain binding protein 1-like b [Colossoma macropomum]|uniref:WW domain binding protein 1-like b n=1 Tax=Colossoma macropomum TaxID=42526 RepID=UPI001863A97E|nr:WW domain binding protein 1-like b [Colossoma macropomum]